MKKILIIAGVVIVVGAMVIVSVRQNVRSGTKVYEEEAKLVDSLISTVRASGEVQPRVYVNISSQVPGEIVGLRVEEGDRVKNGDLLVQLDPEQYRQNVARLEANLRLARINLEKEKAALAIYKRTLDRQLALASESVVSAETLETAELQHETSRIQVLALEEQIIQAEADLSKARDELAKTTIEAPMTGLVTRVNAKEGEQVIIGTMNNPGTVILVLSDMSELLAEVKVDETEVAQVEPGQKASVSVDALEWTTFEGAVAEIAHTAFKERDVSRFIVKVSLEGTDKGRSPGVTPELPLPVAATAKSSLDLLRPGMTAHASIQVASRANALVVPIQAVIDRKRGEVEEALKEKRPDGDGSPLAAEGDDVRPASSGTPAVQDETVHVVFVDRNGTAEMIPVTTGLSDEFNVEILDAPLQAGDQVVIGPYRTLKKLEHGEQIVRAEKDEDLDEQ